MAAGIGGVLWDFEGEVAVAFSDFFVGITDVNTIEALAIAKALEIVGDVGFHGILLESDSLLTQLILIWLHLVTLYRLLSNTLDGVGLYLVRMFAVRPTWLPTTLLDFRFVLVSIVCGLRNIPVMFLVMLHVICCFLL